MHLDKFDNSGFDRGRSRMIEGLWRACEGLLFNSWLPGSAWRVAFLRLFGAKVGRAVVIKPHVRIKFPWKLSIGDFSWIGEQAWIDNLAEVQIGSHCCISQGVYLCTGNHRWDRDSFDLEASPISIKDHCWIGAMSKVGPGVVVNEGAALLMGGVASMNLESWSIYGGVPAQLIRERPKAQTLPDA
jgi:putative colanic acid biosynthesis acetyltransferase WcaF